MKHAKILKNDTVYALLLLNEYRITLLSD